MTFPRFAWLVLALFALALLMPELAAEFGLDHGRIPRDLAHAAATGGLALGLVFPLPWFDMFAAACLSLGAGGLGLAAIVQGADALLRLLPPT
jgi:hypothetical protein